jgi:3-phenylpropionate/trans-cinnamate dioxygenase ferredoxin component
MDNWVDTVPTSEIPIDERKIIEIDGTPIVIFNLSGSYYALEDRCTHQHLPLGDGFVMDGDITCPYHGAVFSIKTGEVKAPPACESLNTYSVRIQNNMIQIKI